MNYENKYLKYKNKYLKLREELISQGVNVDEILEQELGNISNKVEQNGGGNNDIFISNNELSEMNLSDTPNGFEQEGGDLVFSEAKSGTPQPDGSVGPPLPSRVTDTDTGRVVASDLKISSPAPNPQRSTTTTNVRNVYNYFDPLYPTYTVPGYNTVVTTTPVYSVPSNTFPILRRNDDFFLDDEPPRRTSRRTSRRKSSRRSSKRKSSRKRSRR